MKLVVGCDEAAYKLKERVKNHLEEKGYEVIDVGVYNEDPSLYPATAEKLCKEIIDGHAQKGILMCGTGIGMAITANKMPGIRAAVCHDIFSTERSVKSNNCQVMCMGARIIAPESALMLLDRWLECEFAGGHSKPKVDLINEIDQKYR
ncbi:MAG: ribose 5-phosphate isomerase B [Catenisphaera adipataccumulans]|jgi:ribose 5-phosphate isomerase B|uniref:ribose 5-phosphate isomerase B n=1 Tax=Catenisphaera adipataccumulans TaxID=700500 RepID=UPI003D8E6E4B